jgi:putative acetyltransferase
VVSFREERPHDAQAIHELNRLTFGQDDEAQIVDRLRAEGAVISSLVAVEEGRVVGHILFSRVAIESDAGTARAAARAPMAVRPERQRQGIGSELVRRGLESCRARGYTVVVVVGHPAYYPRFGFSAELARRLSGPACGEAWMALELTPGALDGLSGRVRSAKAFGLD